MGKIERGDLVRVIHDPGSRKYGGTPGHVWL